MISIKVSDLEILQEESDNKDSANANTARAIANLAIEGAKKDMMIGQLSLAVATLNIEIQQIKEG